MTSTTLPQPIDYEGRSKIGIEWYATEADATANLPRVEADTQRKLGQGYDFGYSWPGRAPWFDRKDEQGNVTAFAVVVP